MIVIEGRGPPPVVVMPGLDPGIHSVTLKGSRERGGMDCRVKPGNDDNDERRWHRLSRGTHES